MAHKIPVVNYKVSRFFPKPRIDGKRVAETVIGPLCYLALFYNLHQLTQSYPFGSSLIDVRMALTLSILAILKSLFKEAIVSPVAGLTSVGLMFRFLYNSGSLTRFGVLQIQTEALMIKIRFTLLLIVILTILFAKTLQYLHEVIANLKIEK